MDRHFSSRIQVSGPIHVNAAFYGSKLHVLGAVQNTDQLPQDSLVQSLRNALISAVNEIKSLNEKNKALKEQIGLLKDRSQVEVSQLQEELKGKDELLRRITKKRRARTKAHIDCLGLLAKKDMELKSSEEHWKQRCDALERSLQQEMAHREESWSRKVQEMEHERNLLCEEWHRKEEEWRKKESQTDEQINVLTSKNILLLELVTNTKVQLENKIKKEHEVKKMKEEEISREGEKVKDQENEKMENKECDKVRNESEMNDGKLKNEKKESKTKKKRGKKKMNCG